jgi:hypothetical protein
MTALPRFVFSFFYRWKSRKRLVALVEARIKAENRISQLFRRLHEDTQKPERGFIAKMILLRQHGMLSNHELRHLANHWHKATRVIHGAKCDPVRARHIVAAIERHVARLDDQHGYRAPQPRKPKPVELITVISSEMAVV